MPRTDAREQKRIQDHVEALLKSYPYLRSNDHALYVRYVEQILGRSFSAHAFMNDDSFPSFESISRARRHVQRLNPMLKDKEAAARREVLEQDFFEQYS